MWFALIFHPINFSRTEILFAQLKFNTYRGYLFKPLNFSKYKFYSETTFVGGLFSNLCREIRYVMYIGSIGALDIMSARVSILTYYFLPNRMNRENIGYKRTKSRVWQTKCGNPRKKLWSNY